MVIKWLVSEMIVIPTQESRGAWATGWVGVLELLDYTLFVGWFFTWLEVLVDLSAAGWSGRHLLFNFAHYASA